ncbi:MAG: helix-turn-helix domain-containing protein [Nitrospirota bacterium]
MEQLLTIKQLSKYLQMSVSHLYKLVQNRSIPVVKIGQEKKASIRFRKEEIDAWLEIEKDLSII